MAADTNTEFDSNQAPPKRPSRAVGLALVMVIVGAALGGIGVWFSMRPSWHTETETAHLKKRPLYQCPMHPSITSDHPGDCPICGMKLVEVKQHEPPEGAPSNPAQRKVKFYRSPMDPKQTSPTPRKDEMGMDYIPVYENDIKADSEKQVQGLATINIDPERQQLIGLRTATVTRGSIAGSWRTVGRVQVDPTRVRKTNVKVEGYIERIFVDFVGRPVRKGEPLFSLYSPSVLAAEKEYLLALQTRDALAKSGALADDGAALVTSARRKLELWDVPAKEIERLEQSHYPSRTFTIPSPIAGVVTAKNVVEGARVNLGDTPYEITDLSVVWVMADAYETDLSQVRVGMQASFILQAYPDQPFKGKVAFIDPILDPKTRTAKVHMHFVNPAHLLMPEMFGEVVLEEKRRDALRVPVDALVRSGTKNVVFLSLGDGKFEPREVQLGTKNGDELEVISGLVEGQQVVTRANFLVDSESQLKSSLSAIEGK
jgi:Cu(I)/Ag(I) efflux system membrane fusion protein